MMDKYPINAKAKLLLQYLNKSPKGLAVEIGSIRSTSYDPDDGYSTYFLAQKCQETNRPFKSVELSYKHRNIANKVLTDAGLPQCVELGNGKDLLPTYGPVSFLLLDSHKFPIISLHQYQAAALAPGAIIIVDDAQRIEAFEFGKATLIKEVLDETSMPYEIIKTVPGWSSLVFSLPKGKESGSLIAKK